MRGTSYGHRCPVSHLFPPCYAYTIFNPFRARLRPSSSLSSKAATVSAFSFLHISGISFHFVKMGKRDNERDEKVKKNVEERGKRRSFFWDALYDSGV